MARLTSERLQRLTTASAYDASEKRADLTKMTKSGPRTTADGPRKGVCVTTHSLSTFCQVIGSVNPRLTGHFRRRAPSQKFRGQKFSAGQFRVHAPTVRARHQRPPREANPTMSSSKFLLLLQPSRNVHSLASITDMKSEHAGHDRHRKQDAG